MTFSSADSCMILYQGNDQMEMGHCNKSFLIETLKQDYFTAVL